MARVRFIGAALCAGLLGALAPMVAVPPAQASITGTYATTANGLGNVIQYWRFGESAGATSFTSEVPAPGGAPFELYPDAPVASGVDGVGTAEFGGDKAVSITSRTGKTMEAHLALCDSCTSSVTVDLWVKPSALPPAPAPGQQPTNDNIGVILDYSELQSQFDTHKGTALWIDYEGRVHGSIGVKSHFGDARVSTTSAVAVGTWSHLQLTYLQTGPLQLAFDGTIEDATDAGPDNLNWQDDVNDDIDRFRLGNHANSGVYGSYDYGHTVGFEGSIDEVILYGGSSVDDALTPEEMATSQGASGKPIGGIPMDDPRSLHARNEALRNGMLAPCECADPIQTNTGNFYLTLPGLSVPARGPGMAFEATYNSSPGDPGPQDGPLGYGWSSSLDVHIERMLDGSISVVQEGGSAVPFRKNSSGAWVTSKLYAATLVDNGNDTMTYTRKKTERFTFKSPGPLGQWSTRIGRLESMSNLAGDTTTISYPNGTSREASAITSGSRSLTVTWENGRIKEVKDQLETASGGPRTLSFGYTNGNLTSAIDGLGGTWAFGYNANHRMTTLQKPGRTSAQLVTNVYDAEGRVESQTDELNRQTLIDYEFGGHDGWTLVTEPGGVQKRLDKYDANGLRVGTVEGYGTENLETTIAHDANFATDSVTAPGNKVTDYAPHANGQPAAITDPTGRVTRFEYNSLDLVTAVEVGERNGSITDMVRTETTYNAAGLVSKTTVAANKPAAEQAVTQFKYTDASHPSDLKEVVDPRNKTWLFSYDPNTGDQISGTDPENYKTETAYNAVGWPTAVKAPKLIGSAEADHVTSYSYDAPTRTTTVTNPAGDKTRTVLTPSGETDYIVTGPVVTGTSGDKTDYTYDAAAQLITVDPPGNGATSYDYWPTGEQKTYTNELGATTVTHYDGAGRIDSETDEGGNATVYGYNAEGMLESVQSPGGSCGTTKVHCTTYSYDAGGRQTRIDYSDATPDVHDIGYDGAGRREEAYVGGVREAWEWSALSKITSHLDRNGDTTTYTWDPAGNLENIGYPGKSTPVVRTFDDAGRLEKVTDFDSRTVDFTYDDFGNWKTSAFGSTSGTVNTDSYQYDAVGRMTAVTWKRGATTLGAETYTRPTATKGMVDAISPSGAAGTAASDNVYDTRDRLVDTNGVTTGTQEFALDDASNLTKGPGGRNQQFNKARQVCWSSPVSAVTAVNASTSASCPTTKPDASATLFSYDDRGRRLTASFEDNVTRTHTYDQADRLTKVADVTGAVTPSMSTMDGQALVGNFDGDTEDDVFFYRSTNTNFDDWVFWGAARNQFGSVNGNFNVGSGYIPATGDFNCDGIDDILWYKPGSGNDYVWFWFGRHSTSSSQGAYDSKQFTITNSFVPVTGDFNADGCSDILWYAAGTATDAIWWGDDDVAVGTNQFDLGAATINGTFEPVAGDFDGNGADDVFWYAPGTTADHVWLFAPSGGTYTSYTRTVNTTTYDLATGDINGDDRDDLLFSNPSGQDVLWWGAPEASFGPANQKILPSIDAGHAPAIGDFDGDGREDLFLYKPTGSGDTIWWGAPQADFPTATGFQNTTTARETTYTYDADGIRATKQTGSGTTQKFTYSTGTGLPLLLKETTGSQATYLIYGPGDQPIEQINPDGTATWLHHDQLGSVRLATNTTNGTEHSRRTYHPYGTVESQAVTVDGTKQPLLGYAGQYTDPESGYVYLRARTYDPATGQLLTVDPLVKDTADPYGYAGGNPANAIDPTGESWYNPTTWDMPGCVMGRNPDGGCTGAQAVRKYADDVAAVAGVVAMTCTLGAVLTAPTGVGAAAFGTCAGVASAVSVGSSVLHTAVTCADWDKYCRNSATASAVSLTSVGILGRAMTTLKSAQALDTFVPKACGLVFADTQVWALSSYIDTTERPGYS